MVAVRSLLLIVVLFFAGSPAGVYAADRSHGSTTQAARSLRGSWYSAEGAITFRNDGLIYLKGKKYYYAVSNGGMIQLSGHNSSNAIPYQLAGGRLTLTWDGKTTVYTRKRKK